MRKKSKELKLEEEEEKETDKTVGTAFFLMFPALLTAGIATLGSTSLPVRGLIIALTFYQFLLLKKFIQDYYKRI